MKYESIPSVEAIEEFTFKNRDRHFRDETLGRMVGLARSETFK